MLVEPDGQRYVNRRASCLALSIAAHRVVHMLMCLAVTLLSKTKTTEFTKCYRGPQLRDVAGCG